MEKQRKRSLSVLIALSLLIGGCQEDCNRSNNPFPEIQYVLEAGAVDGVFIYSSEWLNTSVTAGSHLSDTLRIALRAVLFDSSGGNSVTSGSIAANNIPLSLSSEGFYEAEMEPGNLRSLMGDLTWQINGFDGHEGFNQTFSLREPTFFNMGQAFSDFRTNSDFFLSTDRAINGDDAYVFICGSIGCITTQIDPAAQGSQYTPDDFIQTGIGNGLIQATNRLIDLFTIDQKTYAIIFQTTSAYYTEIIEGNEPKCED